MKITSINKATDLKISDIQIGQYFKTGTDKTTIYYKGKDYKFYQIAPEFAILGHLNLDYPCTLVEIVEILYKEI